uniref:Uncharacterized protein n=1 Tax=Timema shepardi TaxID=629360 RepID=A0A7R9FV80_TIMSH|nr:unnamed protein product [Timema shepardi]
MVVYEEEINIKQKLKINKKLSNTTNEIHHLNKTLVPTLESKITQLKDEIISTEDNKHHIYEMNRIKLLLEERSHVINEMTDYKTKGYLHQKKMVAQLKEEMENNYKNFQTELNIFSHFSQKIKTQMLENFHDKMKSTLNEATQKTDVLKFRGVRYKYTDVNKRLSFSRIISQIPSDIMIREIPTIDFHSPVGASISEKKLFTKRAKIGSYAYKRHNVGVVHSLTSYIHLGNQQLKGWFDVINIHSEPGTHSALRPLAVQRLPSLRDEL